MLRTKYFLSKIRKYREEFLWTSLGQIVSIIGTFYSLKIITQTINIDTYGVFIVGMTIALGINQIIFGPLTSGIHRFQSISSSKGIFETQIAILLFITSVIVVTLCIIINYFELIDLDRKLISLIFLFSIIFGVKTCLTAVEDANRKRKIVALTRVSEPWLKVLLLFLGMIFFVNDLDLLLFSYIVSSLIIMIFLVSRFPLTKIRIKKIKKLKIKSIVIYSLHNSIFGIFTWLHLSSDKWILQSLESFSMVSEYNIIYQLGFYPMVLIGAIINQFIAPIFYQNQDANLNVYDKKVIYLSLFIIVVSFFLSILMFHFENQVLGLFVSEEYLDFSHLTFWMVIAGGIYSSGHLLTVAFQYKLKTKSLMFGKIITSIFGIFCNILFTFLFSIYGLVFSMIIFSVFHYLYFFYYLKNH